MSILVVKTTVLVQSMDDFAKVNAVYAEYFKEPYPARACFEVARLPKGLVPKSLKGILQISKQKFFKNNPP